MKNICSNNLLILILLFVIIFSGSSLSQLNADCHIPNQQSPGKCIYKANCLEYINLKRQQPQHYEKLMFLRKLKCNNNSALICCPLNGEIYRYPSIQSNINKSPKRWKRSVNVNEIENNITMSNIQNISLSLLPKECGSYVINDRIVGGSMTDIDEYPWVALLIYNTTIRCGGTLISKRYVLTAAHCIKNEVNLDRGLQAVRLGEYDLQNEIDCIFDTSTNKSICANASIDVTYDEIIVHENFKSDSYEDNHDIALIRLSHDIKFTEFIKPICLPFSNFDNGLTDGKRLFATGWGITDMFQTVYRYIYSPIKLKVKLPYVNQDNCTQIYDLKRKIKLGNGQICAGGERDKDACVGDSGGPLMHLDRKVIRWILSGVVSYGDNKCGLINMPGVYTRVDYYLDWILNNIKG